jgi:hypothetical protein
MKKKPLKFYNVKTKKSFTSSVYTLIKKGKQLFAVSENAGIKCYRIVSKDLLKTK